MMHGEGGIKAFIAAKPETFKRRVRRGIPKRHRWEVWKAASGAGDRMRPGLYQGLLRVENRWTRSIETDIARTFPDVKAFDMQMQQCLLRVLHAYANLNPEVGYCQGMNFVAGLLLMTSKEEEEAFWMLVCLMDEGRLSGFYEKKFPLLRRYLRAFDKLAAELMPDLRDHFNNEMVQPGMYLHQWFLTLFINCVPMPMALAFWDVIVCCGLEELLPLTVALLRMLRGMLLELQFEDIVRFFKIMRAGEQDCDMAMVSRLVVSQSSDVPISADVRQLIRVDPGGPELVERWESEEDLNSPRSDEGRGGAAGADATGTMLGYFGDIGRQLPIGAYTWWEDVKNNLQGGPRAADVRMKTSI